MSDKNPEPEILPGQIWSLKELPCRTRYVAYSLDTSPHCLILLTDPREGGSVVCDDGDGKWCYTPEELKAMFERLGYTYNGQLKNLIEKEKQS